MKMSDVLRDIADQLDQKDAESTTATGTMIPPLQQKLELLKKVSGVPSVFDKEEPDELADIKKIAGIQPQQAAIVHLQADDEPFGE